MKSLAKIIATGFGSGYVPIAPGTAGAILASIVILLLNHYTDTLGIQDMDAILILLSFTFTGLGIWSADRLQDEWGHDPSKIVVDEMVGIWVTLIFIPISYSAILIGFVLFRIFDIWKPWIIGKAEKLKGGMGVMADDIAAGLVSNLILHALVYFSII